MPRPSSISLGVGFVFLWLEVWTPSPLLCAEQPAELPAEMLLDLDLLTDPHFPDPTSDLARPWLAEETELLDNLEWLDAAEPSSQGRRRRRTGDEGVR